MKIMAIICNIVSFVFTCFVLLTDGIAKEAAYIIFIFLLLLVPIISLLVISPIGGSLSLRLSSTSSAIRIVTIICNIVLFGFICWAFMDQYPHPKEEGFVAYAILTVLTPILNLVVLLQSGRKSAAT
jgi:hypothetical protein